MPRIEIILVRHGETAENAREIFRGRLDVELNQTGKRQAQLLSTYFRSLHVEAVYSSPLKRALHTAQCIARHHGLDVQIVQELVDFDYGKWQGLTHQQVKRTHPELYDKWTKSPQRVKMPGGERLSEVSRRVGLAIKKVLKHNRCILVSHRVPLKVLICSLLKLPNSHFWNIKIDLAGITTFEYDPTSNRFILTKHNDTSQLKSIRRKVLADF
jgi:broad specificity phosphatase PhoE